jgi:hypothetical protein
LLLFLFKKAKVLTVSRVIVAGSGTADKVNAAVAVNPSPPVWNWAMAAKLKENFSNERVSAIWEPVIMTFRMTKSSPSRLSYFYLRSL